jgi:uncharacterized protein YbjT (DUF2867 family)
MQARILVTGASGSVGRHVVSYLRAAGWPVRAMVHRNDQRSRELQGQGADIVVADLNRPDQVEAAMKDVQRAFFLPPYSPYVSNMAAIFAEAARVRRLESVVSLSQWLASPSHPSFLTRQHSLADRMLAALPGVAHTVVNPGFFADNYLRTLPLAAHFGVFPWPYGDSRNAPPSTQDIARVVAHALMAPEQHAGRSYRPTGPVLLSGEDMAGILGKVFRRRVLPVPTPFWLFAKGARQDGASPFLVWNLRHYIQDHRQGAFALGGPTSAVLDVTGRAPEEFETIVRRRAAAPDCGSGMTARLRQLSNFMTMPFRPGYDVDAIARALDLPSSAGTEYAMQSASWLREHDPAAAPAALGAGPDLRRAAGLGVAQV